MSKSEDVRAVAPALEAYAQKFVHGDLWKRPGLSPRDRSIVTVAALIARNQTVGAAVLSRSLARQRREAVGDIGDHHASGLLHRLG